MAKSLPIFGKKVIINETEKPVLEDGTPVYGWFSSKTFSIEIRKDIEKGEKFRVELHELGHALMERLGVTNTGLSEELEEIIVEGYARFITETFNLRYKDGLLQRTRPVGSKGRKKRTK